MKVELLYVDVCPNWTIACDRLAEALAAVGLDANALICDRVETPADAQRRHFRGSPTILVDDKDPFADDAAPVGLACRIYQTDDRPAGGPSVRQLTAALRR